MKKTFRIILRILMTVLLLWGVAFMVLPLPGQIPVLMYHFVGSRGDARLNGTYVSREGFRKQMDYLRWFGFRVISMDEYYEIKTGKRKPRGKEVVLTFDDGHYTFETDAFPILKDFRYPVMLFLISESVKGNIITGSMSQQTIQKLLSNSWIRLGSHTKTHPNLTEITAESLRDEVTGSKLDLEEMFKVPIRDFVYPSGIFDARAKQAVQESGYRMAFTTSRKKLKGRAEDLYGIVRIKVTHSSDNPIAFWGLLSGVADAWKRGWGGVKGVLGVSGGNAQQDTKQPEDYPGLASEVQKKI